MKHNFIAVTILIALLFSLGAAIADEKSEARDHFNIGFKLWKKQDFAAAATEFELSVKLYTNKNNLYNLANCYVALDRSVEALSLFERVLKEFTDLDKEMQKDIERKITEINALIARLKILVNLDGAAVKVDGKEVGTSPLSAPLVLKPGEHEVEVSLSGHDTVTQPTILTAGTQTAVAVELKASKAALTIAANEAGASVSLNEQDMGRTPLAAPLALAPGTYRISVSKPGLKPMDQTVQLTAGEEKSLRFDLTADLPPPPPPPPTATAPRVLFWAGVSGTAVNAVISGVLWGVGASKFKDSESKTKEYNDINNPDNGDEALWNDANDLKGQAENLNKAAVVTTVVTGAFAVLTVVGLVMKKKDKESPMTAEISAVPGGVEVRF